MRDRRWDRFGAAAGIIFVVLAVVAIMLPGTPPKPEDADQVFKDFYLDKQDQLLAQAWLFSIAGMLFLWFAAAVRSVLRRAEGDTGHFADLFLAGAATITATLIVAMGMQTALANQLADRIAPEVLRLGVDFGLAVTVLFGFIGSLIALAYFAVVMATDVLPRWTAWLAALTIVANIVGTFMVFSDDGAFSLEGAFGFVPFVFTVLWLLGTAVAMLQKLGPPGGERDRAEARARG